MLFSNKFFSSLPRLLPGLALLIFSCALLSCSSDSGKDNQTRSETPLQKETDAEVKRTARKGNAPNKGEMLNMEIIEPDFDRGMAEPEIKVEEKRGGALDF